ncbi:MAG: hypothetical protein QOE90_3761 [Thermoplasmata archaeon]|jgi:hypothetical protein|nr:hypothetical protein [Thermoplasmata archaeon]
MNKLVVRVPLLAALVVLLDLLALRSSLLRLVPADLAAPPWAFALFGGLALLLLPALLMRGSPLPAAVAIALPVVTLADYGENKLDWLRTLKDFGVVEGAGPSLPRLALALAVLALLWALHAGDFAWRLRERALARGIRPDEANGAALASLLRSAAAGGFALAVTLAVGALVLGAAALGDLGLGSAAFIVPLAATALVGIAGYLLVKGMRSPGN